MMKKQLFISFLLLVLMSMTGIKAYAYNFAVANAAGKTIYYKYNDGSTGTTVSVSFRSDNYYSNAFKDSNIANATLHVPAESVGAYQAADQWKDFKEIVAMNGSETQKCAIPTIKYIGGKLKFECETEGVEFISHFSTPAGTDNNTSEISIPTTYNVSVYAKKDGYLDSDVATADIDVRGIQGDVNLDGKVTITDAVSVVNIILNNSEAMVEETATFNFKEPLNLNLDPELDQSDKNLLNPNNADSGSLVNITQHTITTGPVVISFSKPAGTPGANISRYGQGAPFCLEIGRLLSITFNLTGECVLKSVNFDQDSDITLPSGQPGSWNYMTNTWTATDNNTTSVTLKNGDQSAKIYTIKVKYLRPSSLR